IVFDSHSAKPSSERVGIRPVGLRARYSGSRLPPNGPPTSYLRNETPSSSQLQSTFWTLTELFLPQISSTFVPFFPDEIAMRSFQKFSEHGKARLPGSSKLRADAGFLLDEANLLAEVALEG